VNVPYENRARPILALDAMGVLFAASDDVAELLIPFVQTHGSHATPKEIEEQYIAASLGQIDAATFWNNVGIDEECEDLYLSGHRLVDGIRDFLGTAGRTFSRVCCLSNDLSRWSIKLRRKFDLEGLISPWVISADVGHRKPSAAIFHRLLDILDVPAERVLFVDDRLKNVKAARDLRFQAVLFDPTESVNGDGFVTIKKISELLDLNISRGPLRGRAAKGDREA
jgi:FMN phosphatase YigB (HAD superfamily)